MRGQTLGAKRTSGGAGIQATVGEPPAECRMTHGNVIFCQGEIEASAGKALDAIRHLLSHQRRCRLGGNRVGGGGSVSGGTSWRAPKVHHPKARGSRSAPRKGGVIFDSTPTGLYQPSCHLGDAMPLA